MPITNKKEWNKCVKINKDPYGKCCVDVARKVMSILDKEKGDFDCHKIICRADDEIKAGGITGFMAGCVAQMVSKFSSRGEEFRKKWNKDNQIGTEGDEANKSGGCLNPALLTISPKGKNK
jgi:hypothetical protein